MRITENKVSLSERDIEDYLHLNPGHVETASLSSVQRWLHRQYKLPSGIADLIGVTAQGDIVVVEIKNVALDASALTQVCRYANDIEGIISAMLARASADQYHDCEGAHRFPYIEPHTKSPSVLRVVVGRSIDDKTMYEAEALNVHPILFHVELTLTTHSVEWDATRLEKRWETYEDLAAEHDWDYAISGRHQEADRNLGEALGFTMIDEVDHE